MMVLKSCKGTTCVKPWEFLHPDGGVKTLHDSLNGHFDTFYTEQMKVEYDRCEFGYLIDAEGPQVPSIYRNGASWSDWA